MLRRLTRVFWVILALLFLLEAWLWDHMQPLIWRVVNLVPWGRLKEHLSRVLQDLPPWAALIVFVIPFVALLPLKFLEVWFLATQQWIAAVMVLVIAKVLGVGLTAFVFDATRERLLQMPWFVRLYDWVMWLRDWAHAQVAPVQERLRRAMRLLRPARAGRFMRLFLRLRRKVQRAA